MNAESENKNCITGNQVSTTEIKTKEIIQHQFCKHFADENGHDSRHKLKKFYSSLFTSTRQNFRNS